MTTAYLIVTVCHGLFVLACVVIGYDAVRGRQLRLRRQRYLAEQAKKREAHEKERRLQDDAAVHVATEVRAAKVRIETIAAKHRRRQARIRQMRAAAQANRAARAQARR